MVIGQFDIVGIALDIPEADALLVVDRDCVETRSISLKLMKPVTGRNREIRQTRRQINVLELTHRTSQYVRGKTFRFAGDIQFFRISIRKRPHHGSIVTCNVMRVKPSILLLGIFVRAHVIPSVLQAHRPRNIAVRRPIPEAAFRCAGLWSKRSDGPLGLDRHELLYALVS